MKISIITATYNSENTISDTIESVLAQSYQDWELIIKDGGSEDNTIEICNKLAEKATGRMRVISSPDKGIYDAMNQGIEAATGEEVGILNSDDFSQSTTFHKELKFNNSLRHLTVKVKAVSTGIPLIRIINT